jgi:hypothetical protein
VCAPELCRFIIHLLRCAFMGPVYLSNIESARTEFMQVRNKGVRKMSLRLQTCTPDDLIRVSSSYIVVCSAHTCIVYLTSSHILPQLLRSVSGFETQRRLSVTEEVHVRCSVDEVTLGQSRSLGTYVFLCPWLSVHQYCTFILNHVRYTVHSLDMRRSLNISQKGTERKMRGRDIRWILGPYPREFSFTQHFYWQESIILCFVYRTLLYNFVNKSIQVHSSV